MPIIGTNFLKMHYERKPLDLTKVKLGKIERNFSIVDVTERKINLKTSEKVIVFKFNFKTNYFLAEPKDGELGKVDLLTEILFLPSDDKQRKEIISSWDKKKSIPNDILKQVLTAGLSMTQTEAIYNAQKIMLPPPIPLPQIKIEGVQSNEKKKK